MFYISAYFTVATPTSPPSQDFLGCDRIGRKKGFLENNAFFSGLPHGRLPLSPLSPLFLRVLLTRVVIDGLTRLLRSLSRTRGHGLECRERSNT